MSFNIYDNKELLEELVKAGGEFQKKYAQTALTEPQPMDHYLSMVNKLVDNLQNSYFPPRKDPNAPPEVGTEAEGEVALSDVNLENLGALVNFLSSQKITLDGKRIAYPANEKPQDDSYQPLALEPNTGGLEPADRKPVTTSNYVNKDLLLEYIRHIQGRAVQTKNKVQEVMVGRLVDEANRALDAGMNKQYKERDYIVADDQVLDQFQQVLDMKTYSVDGGPKVITFGDLKSDTAFNAWLAKAPISQVPVGETTSGVRYVDFKSPDFDICGAIRVVFNRAKYLLSRSTSDELKKRNNAYVEQVKKLASQLTDKAGKVCQLTETTPGAEDDIDDEGTDERDPNYRNVSNRTPRGGKSRGGLTTQDLRKFLNRFPLLEDRIDFQRIRAFMQAYTQITGQTPAAIGNINTELSKIRTNFRVGNAQGFPINSDEIARVLPQGIHPYAYVSSLYSLIANVKQLLNYLKSANYDYMDDQLKEQIDQQVGTGSNDGGAIAVQNLADLQDAMREAKTWRRTS